MKNTEDFDIEDFFEDILNNADSIQQPTFLSTIGKSYYETYLSKILLHVLTKQKSALAGLINNYAHAKKWGNWVDVVEDKLEVVRACTEMSMNGGRADVFLELKYNNDRITFTVENKCYAEEHNTGDDISQTKTYADYIKLAYKDSKNVFYYLKPKFNPSQATCNAFITITYSELNNYIDEPKDYLINDFKIHSQATCNAFITITYSELEKCLDRYNDGYYIINDFKRHIGEFLDMNFNDIEKEYLQNYKTITTFTNVAEGKRNTLIENVMRYLKDEFKNIEKVKFEIVDKNTVLKVYHEDWKTDDYHFYSEIKFEGGCLTNVICQNIAYANKKDDAVLHKYMMNNKDKDHCDYGQWYIFKYPKHFSSSNGFLSDDWIKDLKDWSKDNMKGTDTMKGYYENMSKIVDDFLEWKENHNTNKT